VHAPGVMAGIVLGYVAYDVTHYWMHHAEPRSLSRLHRSLKTHHLYHHYKNPNSNYGISSYLCDWLFGSFDKEWLKESTKAHKLA